MSILSTLQHAAKAAQVILSPVADPIGGGAFTISGDAKAYTGTFYEQNASDPLDPSGIRAIRLLEIIATKDQFSSAPSASPRRSVAAKGATWSLSSTTDMPLHYRLTCRPL